MMNSFVENKLWLVAVFATLFITIVATVNIFGNSDNAALMEIRDAKYQECENEVSDLVGGAPRFNRGWNTVSADGGTVTGSVDVVVGVVGEAIDHYTCGIEIVDGKVVATVESID